MGIFDKMNEPEFIKEDSDLQIYIDKLNEIKEKVPLSAKTNIEREIKFYSIGKYGEDNIAFELKNSGMPMYVLRDIHIEHKDLSAQIDYIVITRKITYLIECKNLIGDIEIDNAGNFIRKYTFNGKKIREGIYSPVTQNQRHLDILRQLMKEKRSNIFGKMLFERYFNNYYKSVVVLANPKTILSSRYAPKDIKNNVIRADKLVKHIKNEYNQSKELENNDKQMKASADFFMSLHTPNKSDFTKKYEEMLDSIDENDTKESVDISKPQNKTKNASFNDTKANNTTNEKIIKKLKEFRLKRSREEKIKPYFIFNDKQMNSLIEKMPVNKHELMNVQGFAEAKVNKYGDEILSILKDC